MNQYFLVHTHRHFDLKTSQHRDLFALFDCIITGDQVGGGGGGGGAGVGQGAGGRPGTGEVGWAGRWGPQHWIIVDMQILV